MPPTNIHKNLIQSSGDTLKKIGIFNPLTIRKKGTRAKAIFALALVCFFWGTTWLASKQGVKHMPALQLAGMRQFFGGICYVVFFIIKGEKWPRGKEWQSILVLGALNFFLSNGLSTWGVKYISGGLASIIGAIFPLWLVIIGMFSNKQKIPFKGIIGLLLGFAGVCIIFYEHLHDFLNPGFRFGILISIAATWSWAFGAIYTKKHAANFNPYFSLGLQMLISGVSLFTVSHLTNNAIPIADIPWQSWLSISYLLIFGSIISFIAYLYALQNLSAGQVSLYAYINPIVAVVLGWLIFDERMTLYIGLGGLVTLFGVFLVNKAYKVPIATPAAPKRV
jgi:drug/metabolite transporter (DMT)-like permease